MMQTILLGYDQFSLKNLIFDEEGATAIEYGLMAALIGATVITGQAALGSALEAMYEDAVGTITAAMGS